MDIKRNGSQPSHGFGVMLMKLVAATIISLSLLASASSQASRQTNQAGVVARTGHEISRKLHWFLRRRTALAGE
jgi:hypothetical protein